MSQLSDARRHALLAALCRQICDWHLREPAIVLLTVHAPLALLGSQLLFAAQPFLGIFTGEEVARELPLLLEDPQAIPDLVSLLENPPLAARNPAA